MRSPASGKRVGGILLAAVLALAVSCAGPTPCNSDSGLATTLLRQRADSFITRVRSADPVKINEQLVDGLEFRQYPRMSGEWYSFYWKGGNVIGPFPLEHYKEPKTLNLKVEEDGAKIRVFGRHYYKRFVVTASEISYTDGELDEVIADLGCGGWRVQRAARWLATRPFREAVPRLIDALDKPHAGHHVLQALRRTTFQRLEHKADWERWYELNGSKSRDEWKAEARENCLSQLRSNDLAARIEGVKLAKVIGGVEEDVQRALAFSDEAYRTSVRNDNGKYVLVITNVSAKPAILAIAKKQCNLSYSRKLPPGQPFGPRTAGGRITSSSHHPPPERYLEILEPKESRVIDIRMPKGMKAGDYRARAYVRDAISRRRYEAHFDLTVP